MGKLIGKLTLRTLRGTCGLCLNYLLLLKPYDGRTRFYEKANFDLTLGDLGLRLGLDWEFRLRLAYKEGWLL